MKVVYVAGPYRGKNNWEIENNIRRAEEVALRIWRTGKAAVICPHTETRFFQGAAPDEIWLDGTLELLRRCDAIFLLPGWLDSVGTRGERHEAIHRGLRVFARFNDLLRWLDECEEADQNNDAFRKDAHRGEMPVDIDTHDVPRLKPHIAYEGNYANVIWELR